MKNYVGRKIRGFRFEDGIDGVGWIRAKEEKIGEVGEVESQHSNCVFVIFKDNAWSYPISLIEQHLIEEETPEIPQLGEGVLMNVSDDGEDWCEAYIIAKLANGRFLATNKLTWKHARPIQQLPKYTHAELVEKIGHDFEYINK
jgi:hypothetical protein